MEIAGFVEEIDYNELHFLEVWWLFHAVHWSRSHQLTMSLVSVTSHTGTTCIDIAKVCLS